MAANLIRTDLIGFDSMRRKLSNFPDNMRTNFLRGGGRAAARVLQKGLKARIAADGLRSLAKSTRISVRMRGPRGVEMRGVVQYGIGGNRRREAHIFEGGAKAHDIKPQPGPQGARALHLGEGKFVSRVRHPGIRARFYAKITEIRDMPQAMRVFETYVDGRVTRYWATGR